MTADRWRCPQCQLLVCEDEPERDDGPIRLGGVIVDAAANSVTVEGRAYTLSPGQAQVMRVLAEGGGVVRSFETLARAWSLTRRSDEYETDERTRARMAVWKIRRRLGADGSIIESIAARGFRLRPPHTKETAP